MTINFCRILIWNGINRRSIKIASYFVLTPTIIKSMLTNMYNLYVISKDNFVECIPHMYNITTYILESGTPVKYFMLLHFCNIYSLNYTCTIFTTLLLTQIYYSLYKLIIVSTIFIHETKSLI